MFTHIACDITGQNAFQEVLRGKSRSFQGRYWKIAILSKLKQIDSIKYRALLISIFIASCKRQSNLWWETRNICRLSISAPIYASPVLNPIPNLHRLGHQRITCGPLLNSSKSIHWLITYWVYDAEHYVLLCACMYVLYCTIKKNMHQLAQYTCLL